MYSCVDKKMIPKHIHQIWIQGEQHLKNKNKTLWEYSKGIRKTFSDCTYTLWDDNLIKIHMSKIDNKLYRIYRSTKEFAAKSDIARYFILYTYGGIYMDIDYETFENFYWLFDGDITFSVVMPSRLTGQKKIFNKYVGSIYGMNNCIFASSKQSHILKFLIRQIKSYGECKGSEGWRWIMTVTGPTALEKAVMKYKDSDTERIRFLPSAILEPIHHVDGTYHIECNNKTMCKDLFPTAVGIHRPSLSWFGNKQLLKSSLRLYDFMDNWWLLIFISFITIFIIYKIKNRKN